MVADAFIASLDSLDVNTFLDFYDAGYPRNYIREWRPKIRGKELMQILSKKYPNSFADVRASWAQQMSTVKEFRGPSEVISSQLREKDAAAERDIRHAEGEDRFTV